MDYAKDMRIDESALDVEWKFQAELALRYGKHFAACKKYLSEAEEEIKVIRSELVRDANEDPDACLGQGVKPTGPIVEAYYRNHQDHKDAKQEVINLQYELDMAEIAKNEVSFTRKAALEALVTLHGQNYFAGPKIPRNISYEVQQREMQKKADAGVAGKMKRRRNT